MSLSVTCRGWRWGKGWGRRSQAGPEALALSQGLLLWLLLSVAGVWASRGPLRPLCRPINATLAAENEACPVCITFTTSICAGYCPSMVSYAGWAPAEGCRLHHRSGWITQGQAHRRQEVAPGRQGGLPL